MTHLTTFTTYFAEFKARGDCRAIAFETTHESTAPRFAIFYSQFGEDRGWQLFDFSPTRSDAQMAIQGSHHEAMEMIETERFMTSEMWRKDERNYILTNLETGALLGTIHMDLEEHFTGTLALRSPKAGASEAAITFKTTDSKLMRLAKAMLNKAAEWADIAETRTGFAWGRTQFLNSASASMQLRKQLEEKLNLNIPEAEFERMTRKLGRTSTPTMIIEGIAPKDFGLMGTAFAEITIAIQGHFNLQMGQVFTLHCEGRKDLSSLEIAKTDPSYLLCWGEQSYFLQAGEGYHSIPGFLMRKEEANPFIPCWIQAQQEALQAADETN